MKDNNMVIAVAIYLVIAILFLAALTALTSPPSIIDWSNNYTITEYNSYQTFKVLLIAHSIILLILWLTNHNTHD